MEFTFEDVYDDVEKIPAQFRTLYAPGEGGALKLDAEKFGGVREAVVGLNKALKASRAEAKTYKSKAATVDLGKLAEFGETPDGILETFQARLTEAAAAAKNAGSDDVRRQLDKVRQELIQQHDKVLKEREGSIGVLRAQLEETLGRQVALSALSGKAIDPELALPFVLQQLKPVEKDGKLRMVVVDADGDPRINPVTQQEVTIAELVEEMRANKRFGPIFLSEGTSGGGSPPTQRATSARQAHQQQLDRSKLTSVQKIAQGLRKGQAIGRPSR